MGTVPIPDQPVRSAHTQRNGKSSLNIVQECGSPVITLLGTSIVYIYIV